MKRYLCEPMIVYKDPEYYNCNECFNTDCGYWSNYNHIDEKRERVLNPDIAEFFNATCERYRKND
jgi:hypothetical protein